MVNFDVLPWSTKLLELKEMLANLPQTSQAWVPPWTDSYDHCQQWLERHLVGALTAPLRLSPSTKKNSEPLWCFSVKTVRFHWTAHRGCHVNHHEIGHRFWRTWKALKLMNLGTDLQCDEGFHVLWQPYVRNEDVKISLLEPHTKLNRKSCI